MGLLDGDGVAFVSIRMSEVVWLPMLDGDGVAFVLLLTTPPTGARQRA